jgi:hypothetical protein
MKFYFIPSVEQGLWKNWAELASHWFAGEFTNNWLEELYIIPHQKNIDEKEFDNADDPRWKEIHTAWQKIHDSQSGHKLDAWRIIFKHGQELAPNLRVFRLRNWSRPCFFWLSSQNDLDTLQARLADLLPKIASYWHAMNGRGLFHAAGIIHKDQAYLFVGASGAGKSTVSALSKERGDKIIHDDHVVVYRGADGKWLVSDTSHSVQGVPVKAILFLIQDSKDQLIPANSSKTVKGLMKSLNEHGSHILFDNVIRSAFSTCAEIGRLVPGYELYFRKSPEFWELIDERFPN